MIGNSIVFSYTVQPGDSAVALKVARVALPSGAAITDKFGYKDPSLAYNDANLSIAGLAQAGPVIDTAAPGRPVIAGCTVNANKTVTLNGSAEASSTVTIYNGSAPLGTVTANGTGAWSYTTQALANGTYGFLVTATDAAGNMSVPSAATVVSVGGPVTPVVLSVGVSGEGIVNQAGDLNAGHVVTFRWA